MTPVMHHAAEYKQLPAMETMDKAVVQPCPLPKVDGRDLPSHLLRELAPVRSSTNDPVGRRIASLLRLHPQIDQEYSGIDLRRISPAERRVMLSDIEKRLGI